MTVILILILICLVSLKISKSIEANDLMKDLSKISKLEAHISILKQERNDYAILVTHLLDSSMNLVENHVQNPWEREFCQSIIRNQGLLDDARKKDTGSTFSHAINILRSNYSAVEKLYFNETFFQNYKISEQIIYGCLDGEKESLLIMFSSVIKRSEMIGQQLLVDHNQFLVRTA